MRCLLCKSFSLEHICKSCQTKLLRPTIRERELLDGFHVYSFYAYSEIDFLLKTKHTYIGSFIYKILAQNSFKVFAQNFQNEAYVVGVDTKLKNGYSHTAILTRQMKTSFLKPLYNTLLAKNKVSYSGKSLDFRLKNPRGFEYRGKEADIILVDDIITTGTTLKEAFTVCSKAGANVLFALVLADAKY